LSGAALPGLWTTVVEQDVSVQPRGRWLQAKLMIPVVRTVGGGVRPTGHSASAMLRGVALADGFLLVPPGGIRAGEQGAVVWFPWTPAGGQPLLVLPTNPPTDVTDIPLPLPTLP
jgi:molybdopterin molybdotransferase